MLWLPFTVVLAVYLSIALFSLYMTHQEQKRNAQASLRLRLASWLLCIAWPLLVLVVLVYSLRHPAPLVRSEID